MKRVMAVYDVDPFYADKFAEYANLKERVPFKVIAFTSLARMKTFATKEKVDLLLIGDEVKEEEFEDIPVGQVIRLSESGISEINGTPSVYKYQTSDNILREVMSCYQVREEPAVYGRTRINSRIIGVYSPVGRCGKTGFCMTYGQILAKQNRVLLLSMEDFTGYSRMTGTEYQATMSDLLYYFRLGEYNRLRLAGVSHNWNGLDYVPPAMYAEDLNDVTGEELVGLISEITQDSGYDVILLDLGHFGKGIEPLLELCQVIYTPVLEDSLASAKIEEWRGYLETSGRQHLWEKVEVLHLPLPKFPVVAERYLEDLLWGDMGDFVRELVRGKEC